MSSVAMGALLKSARINRSESMQAVAHAAGLSKAHVCEVERGGTEVSFAKAVRLADHLGVNINTMADCYRQEN